MRNPIKKKVNKLTPEVMYKPVIQYLMAFMGLFFNEFKRCSHCRSTNCKKHNIIEKIFCKLIIDGKFVDVKVHVQVFYCNKCGKTYLAKSPFYKGIMYCKPVVNLCLYLASKNPYHRG